MGRVLPYTQLAKLEFFDFYLSILVVWSLLPVTQRLAGENLLALSVFLIGEAGVVTAVMVFDDITGYLDGSDRANYLGERSGLRKLQRKPLLTGALTLSQAKLFGYASLTWGVVVWGIGILVAPHRPPWAVLLIALGIFTAVQYSWGIKFSYVGLGELLIAATPMIIVIAPYALVTGEITALVMTQALLFGLWQILVSSYSNTNDIEGDRTVGRSTVAARASKRGNRLFIGALTALDFAIIGGSAALGYTPWWFPLAMLPVMALRLRQFVGFASNGNALLARRRGVNVHRVGVGALVLVNLVYLAN